MFKDKNFGLPKDLIESARSVMEKKDPILDKGQSGWETRGVSAGGEKAFIKTPEYTATITDEGPVERKKFDVEAYKKETKAIQKSPGRFSPDLRLGENHVVKFTSYLKENFHINELTEEEIAWIYENEYINEIVGENEAKAKAAAKARADAAERQNQAVKKAMETAKGSEVAHNVPSASASFRSAQEVGMDPESQGKAQKEVKRVLSTPEAKKRKLERMVPKTSDAFAQDYDDEIDKPTPPTPTPPSRPAASARRETGSTDSDSSGPSSSQSFTSYRRSLGLGGSLKDAQSEPYKRAYGEYRKAKTPKKSFSQTAYEPGGVFDRD